MKNNFLLVLLIIVAGIWWSMIVGCNSSTSTATTSTTTTTFAPVDLSIFTHFVTDEAGDTDHPGDPDEELPPGGVVYFDEIDIIRIACATYEGRIYIYTQVATTFTTSTVTFEDGEEVSNRTFNICVDLDNNNETGLADWGTDLHTTVTIADTFENGITAYYSLYETGDGLNDPDSSNCQVNNGGVGYNYVVASVSAEVISNLGIEVASGDAITLIAWSESESTNYHHYAFDELTSGESTRVGTVMGREK